jgi:NADPH2:quinone reductase
MTAIGEPDVLQISTIPDPTIQKATEILIRLHAAGINPIDTKLRKRGTFYPDRMPTILGCDGAGVVEAVGSAVQKFRPGDQVYFCNGGIGGHPGNYAEWTVMDERFAAPKPRSLSFAEAAAAPLVLITAWEALCDRGRLQAGQRVLIHAGAGGVGHVAIQLAKLQGASVCTTVSTPEKADFVKRLGADRTILYQQTDVVQATLDWTNGQGVNLAFDTIGGSLLSKSFAATQIYGDVVTILEPAPDTDWKTARLRNQRVSFELMLTPMLQGLIQQQQAQASILEHCAQWIDQGKLTIHVNQALPLADAAEAHRLLEAGRMIGKLVLVTDS